MDGWLDGWRKMSQVGNLQVVSLCELTVAWKEGCCDGL